MSTGTQFCRNLAALSALGAVLLAGLALAGHLRRAVRPAEAIPAMRSSASAAPAANRILSTESRRRAIPHTALLKAVPASTVPYHRTAVATPSSLSPSARPRAIEMYGALPISFEANNGQSDPRVKFLAHGPGYTLFLTTQEAVLSLPDNSSVRTSAHLRQPFPQSRTGSPSKSEESETAHAVRLKFVSAGAFPAVDGRDPLPGKTNYFIGNDPNHWHTNVPNYSAVQYRNIYPGIDAIFHGDNRKLEFDFNIAPGADPQTIALEVEGTRRLHLNHAGEVVLSLDTAHELVMNKPRIYQQFSQGRRQIAGNYVLRGRERIAFALGPYDHSRPLVIDPTLVYSTYLGGGISQESYANAIAVDSSSPNCSAGCAVVAGSTSASTVFPTTSGSYDAGPAPTQGNFAFITKFKSDGSGLVYSTYFGGTISGYPNYGGGDQIYAIAVDSTGAAYFGGISETGDNTPTTLGSFMPIRPSQKPVPFVSKLSPDGSKLVYSTYLDGTPHNDTDGVSGIAVDSSFSAYVTGNTTATDFPTTTGAFQTVFGASTLVGTAFITKLSSDGSSLVYSTYLGGNYGENVLTRGAGGAIALDSSNDAYVTGNTYSTNFPTKNPYIGTCNSPCSDAYVSELNPSGTELIFSTFLGGTTASKQAIGMGIAVDSSDSAYVGGTTSFTDFPATSGAVQSSPGVGFIAKLAPNGTGLNYSSYFNGYVNSVAVGSDNSAVLFGYSNTSFAFDSTADAFTLPACTGSNCFFDFISKLKADGSGLVFSTPIGANMECCAAYGALDPAGNAYIAGSTASLQLPTTPGSFEPALPSNYTGYTPYVAKIAFSASASITISPTTLTPGTAGSDYSQTLTATGGTGTVTFAVTTASLPAGITLASDGLLSGTPTQTGTFPFTVTATDAASDTGTQAYSLVIACQVITVGPVALDPGASGTAYPSITFTETGGIGATTFSETGALPTGITFASAILSGTPTQTGSFPFTVTATDSNSCTGSVSPTLTINSATGQPAVVTDNETITVTDSETFPDVADSEKITVTDSEIVRAYTPIAITPSPASFNTNSGTGYATHAYASVQFSATGGTGTLTLSESGALPTGITFTNGALSGTPAASSVGTFAFSITATDAFGDSATLQGYSLTILAASAFPAVVTDNESITVSDSEAFPDVVDAEQITITDSYTVRAFNAIAITPSVSTFNNNDGTGTAGANYGPVTFSATGGIGTLTLTEGGTLPAGLTFNNGILGGTLSSTSPGTYSFSITAVDANNDQASQQGYTLNIAAPPIPSLNITANPDSLTIARGQTGVTTLTFTPSGGYSGTLALSCSGLPEYSVCVFTENGTSVNSVTLSANNQPVNVQLAFETDVNTQQARLETTSPPARHGAILTAFAFWWPGSLVGLAVFLRKRETPAKSHQWFRFLLLVLVAGAVSTGLAGCIGKGTHLTPLGSSTVTVIATPGSGTAQTLSINIDITQ